MRPVLQLEGVVGVRDVLFGQFVLRFDPVGQLCSFFLVELAVAVRY